MVMTPASPMITATHRLGPTCSLRIGIERTVIKSGATKKIAMASAIGIAATAINNAILAIINNPPLTS